MALENYALNAAANIFQEQINVQNQLIAALLKSSLVKRSESRASVIRESNESHDEHEPNETNEEHKENEDSDSDDIISLPLDSVKLIDISEELDNNNNENDYHTTETPDQLVKSIIQDDDSFKYYTLQPSANDSSSLRPSSSVSSARRKPMNHPSITDMRRILRPQQSLMKQFEELKAQHRRPLSARQENQMQPKMGFDEVMSNLKSKIAAANKKNETPSAALLNRRRQRFRP